VLPFVARRLVQVGLTLLLLAVAAFAVLRTAPGGPAAVLLGPDYYTPEREAQIDRTLGLDQPLPFQLVRWLGALATGDLGYSYFHKRPASEVVGERLGPTVVLGLVAWTISLVGGVALGAWAGLRRGGFVDRVVTSGAVLGLSTPSFWLGIVLIVVFAAWLQVLPSAGLASLGYGDSLANKLWHLALPAATLATAPLASLALYARAAVLDVLGEDFVRTARAKGLAERLVARRHVLRAAAIPITTIAALNLAHLLEGSIVVETVFAWPGIGHLTVSSVARRDYPVLMVIALLAGAIVVVVNLATDVVYRRLDPRVGLD